MELEYIFLIAILFLLIFAIVICISSTHDYHKAIKRIKNLEEQFDLIERQNARRLDILEEQWEIAVEDDDDG